MVGPLKLFRVCTQTHSAARGLQLLEQTKLRQLLCFSFTIKQDLIAVVEEGTGRAAKVEGKTIAGKTGTAEIKAYQQDKDGTEIGWFDAFDEDGLLVVSMCENVKDEGGSHYLLPKVKTVFE